MKSSNIHQLVRKNIRELTPYSSAREECTEQAGVFLDANENPYGIYNRYPDPYQVLLKQRIAEIKNINTKQIFVGNGSDEVIDLAFRIFCEPYKDRALTFTPTYGMYEVAAAINAIELVKVPLNDEFQIDMLKVNQFLSDPAIKLVFICSPNNPTGNLLKNEDIEHVLKTFKGIVVVDEAYIDFAKHPSLLEKLESFPNLIISQTLSKAWGLASLRLGLAFMSEELLSYYNKVKAPYNISSANQHIAMELLNGTSLFQQNVNEILSERSRLIQALKKMDTIKKIYPTDANFILIEVENAVDLYNRLLEMKIIIRNRHSVVNNCVRITVGKPEENQLLITALKKISNG